MENQSRDRLSDRLSGVSFVVTGSFEKYSREQLKELIENNGGKFLTSVSGNTDYLLAGEKVGKTKLEKAERNGTKIINLDEFLAMIELVDAAEPYYEAKQQTLF